MQIPQQKRRHMGSVFNYIEMRYAVYRPSSDIIEPRNPHLPPSLDNVGDAAKNIAESQVSFNAESKVAETKLDDLLIGAADHEKDDGCQAC